MKRLQAIREGQGLSKSAVSRKAELGATQYGWVESGRYVPYPRELARIAAAWAGRASPEERIVEEVDAE